MGSFHVHRVREKKTKQFVLKCHTVPRVGCDWIANGTLYMYVYQKKDKSFFGGNKLRNWVSSQRFCHTLADS